MSGLPPIESPPKEMKKKEFSVVVHDNYAKGLHESHSDSKHTTFDTPLLSPETIRWMNKRRPKGSARIPGFIRPALAGQLCSIFDNLDQDHSGSVDLGELKHAVKLVVTSQQIDKNASKELMPLNEVKDFFTKMDNDGSGTIDYVEFVANMSTPDATFDDLARETRMRNEFYEFTSRLRRKNILDNLASTELNDVQKFSEVQKLFEIDYFIGDHMHNHDNRTQLHKIKLNQVRVQGKKNQTVGRARASTSVGRARSSSNASAASSASETAPLAPIFRTSSLESPSCSFYKKKKEKSVEPSILRTSSLDSPIHSTRKSMLKPFTTRDSIVLAPLAPLMPLEPVHRLGSMELEQEFMLTKFNASRHHSMMVATNEV